MLDFQLFSQFFINGLMVGGIYALIAAGIVNSATTKIIPTSLISSTMVMAIKMNKIRYPHLQRFYA